MSIAGDTSAATATITAVGTGVGGPRSSATEVAHIATASPTTTSNAPTDAHPARANNSLRFQLVRFDIGVAWSISERTRLAPARFWGERRPSVATGWGARVVPLDLHDAPKGRE